MRRRDAPVRSMGGRSLSSTRLFPFPHGKGLGVRSPRVTRILSFCHVLSLCQLCHPERSRRISAKRCSCLCVILTVASERSLRATTSDSFAQRSRYRFQISASNWIVILSAAKSRAKRVIAAQVAPSYQGEADASPSMRRVRVQIPNSAPPFPLCHPERSQGPEPVLSILEGRSDASSSPFLTIERPYYIVRPFYEARHQTHSTLSPRQCRQDPERHLVRRR
jgi:hypothetical protein